MGGSNSGRYSHRPKLDDALTLDINAQLKNGILLPGNRRSGTITWSYVRSGKVSASIAYTADMRDASHANVVLSFSIDGEPQHQTLRMDREPCRFGGYRWWWSCPRTGRPVMKLYLPPGARRFASNRVYRLAYRSNSEDGFDRARQRVARLYSKLGGTFDAENLAVPERPKGMHRRTYVRLAAELEQAIVAYEDHLLRGLSRLMRQSKAASRD